MKMRRFLFIIPLTFILSSTIFAQPVNDLCSTSIVVIPDGTCINGTTVGGNDNIAGVNGCQSGGSVSSHEDVWYQFTATSTDFFAAVIANPPWTGNVELMLYSGTCAAPVLFGSQCGPSPLNAYIPGLTIGNTYFIAVSNQGTGTNGPFAICPATPFQPNINSIPDDTICNADSININLTSDQDPSVFYTWTVVASPWISGAVNGTGTSIDQLLTNSGSTLNSATYYVTVSNGFMTDTTSFTITVVPPINALITSPQTTTNCDTADILLTATNTAVTPTYLWSTGATTPTILVNAVGTYSVVVTSIGQCLDSSSITITPYVLPNINAGPDQIFLCNDDSMFLYGSSSTPGVGFFWSTPNGSILSGGPSGTQLNIGGGGTYILEINDPMNNCYVYDTVIVATQPVPTISFVDSISPGCGTPTGVIMVTATGGTPGYIFSWSGSPTNNDTLSIIPSGTYTATVTDVNGCSSSIVINLGCTMLPPTVTNPLSIPQFLSPNGDGDNDIWIIQNIQFYPNHVLKIFNRWGNEIYSASPYLNDWGGIPNIPYSIGQDIIPAGTYFYVLDVYGDQSDIRASYIEVQK